MTNEIWKPIPNYEGYMVSNLGNVKSVDRLSSNGRHLKGKPLRQVMIGGYLYVRLCKNGKMKNFFVHRLVMLAFVGKCSKGMEVNHIDENKENNCLSNLEYITKVDNCNYGTRNIRISLSNRHPKTKEHCEHISKGRKGMKFTEEHKRNIAIAKKKQCGRKVQCIDNGIIYDCVADAERAAGLKAGSNIPKACMDSTKKCGGYRWRYV